MRLPRISPIPNVSLHSSSRPVVRKVALPFQSTSPAVPGVEKYDAVVRIAPGPDGAFTVQLTVGEPTHRTRGAYAFGRAGWKWSQRATVRSDGRFEAQTPNGDLRGELITDREGHHWIHFTHVAMRDNNAPSHVYASVGNEVFSRRPGERAVHFRRDDPRVISTRLPLGAPTYKPHSDLV